MSAALALLAMLIELCLGYPQFVLRAIGHPVTWTGRLIGALDRALNRETASANARRAASVAAVAILVAVVGAVAFLVQRELLRWPGGVLAAALLASTLIAQRSLHRHVADVAVTLARETSAPRASRYRTSSDATRPRSMRRASPAPRSRAWRKISPTASSRRYCGSPSPASLAPHSTRRSIPPTA
jgi:cobalamin biosynthesis protein CobD/CbiB